MNDYERGSKGCPHECYEIGAARSEYKETDVLNWRRIELRCIKNTCDIYVDERISCVSFNV